MTPQSPKAVATERLTALIDRMPDWCIDYDGTPMPDGAEPRVVPNCGDIRALVTAVADLKEDRNRFERNRDMWKGQCERQAAALSTPSPRIVELEARIAELEGEAVRAKNAHTEPVAVAWRVKRYGEYASGVFGWSEWTLTQVPAIGDTPSTENLTVEPLYPPAALSTAEARGLERAAKIAEELAVAQDATNLKHSAHAAAYESWRAMPYAYRKVRDAIRAAARAL